MSIWYKFKKKPAQEAMPPHCFTSFDVLAARGSVKAPPLTDPLFYIQKVVGPMISIEDMTSVRSGRTNPIMISRLIYFQSMIILPLRSLKED
jgi:hypothetical protein